MKNIYKNFSPLCFLSNTNLLLYKRGTFYILNISSSKYKVLGLIRVSIREKLMYHIPLIPRLFRMGIRCTMKISENTVLIAMNNYVHELNLIDGSISKGFSTYNKSRPLVFSQIQGIEGFDDGIYFGEYMSNPCKNPVGIYKRITTDNWIKTFEFQKGTIEHVHNIIGDKNSNSVFIFTGDFDQSSGIWIAKDNFHSVEPLFLGDQKYRGCVAFSTPKGIIYATDSPFTDNSIRLITKEANDQWVTKRIHPINGPSILGCEWNGNFVFSTSVEGDGRNLSLFYKLFGRRRGVGIKSDFSVIYKGNLENGFEVIYKAKKDILPFFLFQFGLLVFPAGINNSKYLPIYHIATNRYSLSTLILSE